MTLQEIVDQLRACEFTCEAGRLEMNVAFQELEKIANTESYLARLLNKGNCHFELYETTPCEEAYTLEELDNIRVE
jgi:hypothetical protein